MKVPAGYFIFQTKEHLLTVNKSEITSEHAFTQNFFGIEDNNELSEDKNTWFQVVFKICYSCYFNL